MARTPPDPKFVSNIYIDESSQTKHRYLCIGGMIVPSTEASELEQRISQARLPELPAGEMGWVKVSRSKLPAYRRVVDMFFDSREAFAHLDFHCLVVDTSLIRDRQFNAGLREIGFNKEIYQLALKFGRLYTTRLFHLYPDRRETKSDPEQLRLIINRGIRAKGDKRPWPYRRLHFRDSNQCLSLQLVDVLLGAVAFMLNDHHLKPDASPAKMALARHVLGRAGIRNVGRDTAVRGQFTIWHRRLQVVKSVPQP